MFPVPLFIVTIWIKAKEFWRKSEDNLWLGLLWILAVVFIISFLIVYIFS